MIVKRYRFDESASLGRGPLKSMFNRSNGCVDLIKVEEFFTKDGLISVHIGHFSITVFTSFVEYGKFRDLTKCIMREIPG